MPLGLHAVLFNIVASPSVDFSAIGAIRGMEERFVPQDRIRYSYEFIISGEMQKMDLCDQFSYYPKLA
jgi:hypothetical protein